MRKVCEIPRLPSYVHSFDEGLQVLKHLDVLGVFIGGAVSGELIHQGGVNAALLQHTHEQIVEMAVKDVAGDGILLVVPLSLKNGDLIDREDVT